MQKKSIDRSGKMSSTGFPGGPYRVLLAMLWLPALLAGVPAQAAIRIMPLGDSITYGDANGGYRNSLYTQLTNAGYSIDFVGSVTSGNLPDPQHEGHPGWRADHIRDNITNWLNTNPADIILLHIGTNDIGSGELAPQITAEIGQILDRINDYEIAHGTSIPVILARIINWADPQSTQGRETTTLNASIQTMADGRILNGDRLMVVDMEKALSYPGDLVDLVHPNAGGYVKMANVWFNALNSLFCTRSDFVSDTIPATMARGGSYSCSITMKNSGCQWICWPVGTMLTVGQFNGPAVCKLIPYPFYEIYTNPCIVDAGQNCTFPFTISVPEDAPAGQYEITWQMKDNNHWFGEFRDNQIFHKTVTVTCNQGDFISDTIPPTMTAGGSYNCVITMKNSGCQPWSCSSSGTSLTVGQVEGPMANKLIPPPYYQIYTDPCQIDVGQNCTFPFTINVPADTPSGTYEITWQMKDNLEWFNSNGHNAVFRKNVTVVPPPPAITSAVSRKTQGPAGIFDIDVRASGTVECRKDGPTLVVITFDRTIQGIDGLSQDDVNVSSGTVTQLTIAGNSLEVQIAGVADAGKLIMTFPGIADATVASVVVVDSLCIRSLFGDTNNDASTNVLDLLSVRNAINRPVNAANFRNDITMDGGINVFDLLSVKNNLNKKIIESCP